MAGFQMVTLGGYDGRFGLRCWPGAVGKGAPSVVASDDLAALRAKAESLVGAGACGRVELLAWNFELNDWVRMEWNAYPESDPYAG
jgi:hypothetical protein